MLESTVEKYFVDELAKIGVKTKKVRFIGVDGCPDRLVFVTGGIWVEMKRPKAKPRPNQQKQIDEMRANGFTVFTISEKQQVDQFVAYVKWIST